jgi:HSP20 family protein
MSKKQQSRLMSIVPMYHVPFRDVRDRLFDRSFLLSHVMDGWGQFGAVDLSQTETEVIIRMALPGADPANIQVSATENTITLSGEVKQEYRNDKEQPDIEEIAHGRFQRSFSLPAKVNPESASATYENGILTVTLPKSISAKARTIPVAKPRAQQGQKKHPEGTVEQVTVPVESASPA